MTAALTEADPVNPAVSEPRAPRTDRLPVTLLSGFVGSGKTVLLNQILKKANGLRIAALINNASSNESTNAPNGETEDVVHLENGCICCTLRGRFIEELQKLAKNTSIDYCIVVSSGAAEPMCIAESFDDDEDENGNPHAPLSEYAYIDTMVTLLDAQRFPADLTTHTSARDRAGDALGAARKVPELLAEQLEFANVIVVNNCDHQDGDTQQRICGAVRAYNSTATVLHAVKPTDVIATQSFSFETTSAGKRWLSELRDAVGKSGDAFVYRRRRPFDPRRFATAAVKLARMGASILRGKGFVWLATKNEGYAEWSQVGVFWNLEPGGRWLCETPREEWPDDPDFAEMVRKDMHEDPAIGDRRQELVFIGQGMEVKKVEGVLDECLLTDEEMKGGVAKWKEMVDPFGDWEFGLESDGEADAVGKCGGCDGDQCAEHVESNGTNETNKSKEQPCLKRALGEDDTEEELSTSKRTKLG